MTTQLTDESWVETQTAQARLVDNAVRIYCARQVAGHYLGDDGNEMALCVKMAKLARAVAEREELEAHHED